MLSLCYWGPPALTGAKAFSAQLRAGHRPLCVCLLLEELCLSKTSSCGCFRSHSSDPHEGFCLLFAGAWPLGGACPHELPPLGTHPLTEKSGDCPAANIPLPRPLPPLHTHTLQGPALGNPRVLPSASCGVDVLPGSHQEIEHP